MGQGVEVSKELDLPIRRNERLTSARPIRLHEVIHHPCGSMIPERPLRKLKGERIGSLPGRGERLGHFAARAFAQACKATTPADSASDSSTRLISICTRRRSPSVRRRLVSIVFTAASMVGERRSCIL